MANDKMLSDEEQADMLGAATSLISGMKGRVTPQRWDLIMAGMLNLVKHDFDIAALDELMQ